MLHPSSHSHRTLIILCIGAVILIIYGITRGETSYGRYTQLKQSKGILEKTVSALREENSELSEEIVKLKESPNYARKVLRDRYHITEPDEDIIFFAE